jgi:hypothetical protein
MERQGMTRQDESGTGGQMNKDKRHGTTDRRLHDYGPPTGWRDRRRKTERRIPNVEEQVISEEEWLLYFGTTTTSTKTTVTVVASHSEEHSAHILGRARD